MEHTVIGEGQFPVSKLVEVIATSTTYSLFLRQWTSLARRFNIPDRDIDKLHLDYIRFDSVITDEDLVNRLLTTWKTRDGSNATIGRLCSALDLIKFKEIAENVEKEALKLLREHFLLHGKVDFHGKIMKIGEIVKDFSLESFSKHITNEMLEWSVLDKPVKLFQDLCLPVSYYIQRSLKLSNKLREEIFQVPARDVFVFIGLEPYELTQVSRGNQTDISSSQTRRVTARFILLEYELDFGLICKHSNYPVHLIEYKGGQYFWLKSHGEVTLVQRYIHEEQETCSEAEFVTKNLNQVQNTPVCIADTPGMGKTVLLQNIAYLVKEEYSSNRVVLFFILREIIPLLENIKEGHGIILLLLQQAACNSLGAAVLKHIFSLEALHFEMFFDGFDELLQGQIESAKGLFKSLTEFKNIRIYVTTRPHLRTELELTLGVIGYTIVPFTEQNQVDFLKSFWMSQFQAEDTPELEEFAYTCLQKVGTDMSDFERDITGVPLQCAMLAEVYSYDAVKYSKGLMKYTSSVNINSISDMYQELIKQKFEKLDKLRKSHSLPPCPDLKNKVMNEHIQQAVSLLFPDWIQKLNCIYVKSEMTQPSDEVFVIGIIELSPCDGTPRFLHRTFAEYLLAQHLVQEISNNCANCASLLVQVVLGDCIDFEETVIRDICTLTCPSFLFRYPTLAYFVDAHLIDRNYELDPCNYKEVTLTSPNIDQMLRACCSSDLSHCFQFIATIFNPQIQATRIMLSDMLLVAGYSSRNNIKLVQHLVKLIEQVSETPFSELEFPRSPQYNYRITPLHVAVNRGSYVLTEYFLRMFSGQETDLQYLLHFCVHRSIVDKQAVVNRKIQIIKLISKMMKHSLEEKWPENDNTPIISENVHVDLIECLVNQGADINAVDKNSNNVLHKLLFGSKFEKLVSSSDYTKAVNLLKSVGFNRWDHKNKFGWTPFIIAVRNMELEREVLQHYLSVGVNFNSRNENGFSMIHIAALETRSAHFMQQLIELGCDPRQTSSNGQTVLQLAAAAGNFDVVRYLVENKISSVNETDKKKCTPLHYAVWKRSDQHNLIQELLIDNLADMETEAPEIPLIHALRTLYGVSLPVIQKMEEKGLDMSKYSNTALFSMMQNRNILASSPEFPKVLKYFYEKGGQFSPENVSVKNILNLIGQKKQELSQITECSMDFLEKMQEFTKAGWKKCSTSEELYDLVTDLQIQLEAVMLALLETKQIKPFQLIRNLFHSSRKFNSPPDEVKEFLSSNDKTLVIHVWCDHKIFAKRILDTVDEVVQFQDNDPLFQDGFKENVTYIMHRHHATLEYLSELDNQPVGRFIMLADEIGRGVSEKYNVLVGLVDWSHLSKDYQEELIAKRWQGFRLGPEAKLKLLQMNPCLMKAMSDEPVTSDELGTVVEEVIKNGFCSEKKNLLEQIAMESLSLAGGTELLGMERLCLECVGWYFVAKVILNANYNTIQRGFLIGRAVLSVVDTMKEYDFKMDTYAFRQDLLLFFIDWMIGKGAQLNLSFEEEWGTEFLEACVFSNAHNLIDMIMQKEGTEIIFRPRDVSPTSTILHLLVLLSSDYPEKVIEIRKQLLNKLVESGCCNINFKINEYNLTPLLMPEIHVELIKQLIILGADIKARAGQSSYTFAHMAACHMSLVQFNELVRFLSEKGLIKEVFSLRDNCHQTPLHSLLRNQELEASTIELLSISGVDINSEDDQGYTPFLVGIACNRTIGNLKTMVQYGARWKHKTKTGSTAIHIAAESTNLEIIKYLLELGCDVRGKNSKGLDPFDILRQNGRPNATAALELLAEYEEKNPKRNCIVS